MLRPLRDQVYIERIRPTESPGGILFPQAFKAGKGGHDVRLKMAAVPDYFPAKVLALGPDVRPGELSEGDEILVFAYAEGDGKKLWTGEGAGERDKMFIKYPDDILCAVEHS